MTEGSRPGGLTALAVINFVFGAGQVLSFFGFLVMLLAVSGVMGGEFREAMTKTSDPESERVFEAMKEVGRALFVTILVMSAVSAVLLITSGVGYLKQKKFLGRTLGNAYATLAVATSLVIAAWLPEDLSGGINLGVIIGLIYPLLTLLLLNTTFKHDFIR